MGKDKRLVLTQSELAIVRNAMRRHVNELREQYNANPTIENGIAMGQAIAVMDKLD